MLKFLHPIILNVLFPHHSKTLENQWFTDIFRGNIEKKWIKYVQ